MKERKKIVEGGKKNMRKEGKGRVEVGTVYYCFVLSRAIYYFVFKYFLTH